MSELDGGLLALNSSRFPSKFDSAPVDRSLPEIPPWEHDAILEGFSRLNSAQFHQSNHQSNAQGGRDDEHNPLSRKNCYQSTDEPSIFSLIPHCPSQGIAEWALGHVVSHARLYHHGPTLHHTYQEGERIWICLELLCPYQVHTLPLRCFYHDIRPNDV